ncbi:unnamed protein product, partial [Chrysoparadoxa australica]
MEEATKQARAEASAAAADVRQVLDPLASPLLLSSTTGNAARGEALHEVTDVYARGLGDVEQRLRAQSSEPAKDAQ